MLHVINADQLVPGDIVHLEEVSGFLRQFFPTRGALLGSDPISRVQSCPLMAALPHQMHTYKLINLQSLENLSL